MQPNAISYDGLSFPSNEAVCAYKGMNRDEREAWKAERGNTPPPDLGPASIEQSKSDPGALELLRVLAPKGPWNVSTIDPNGGGKAAPKMAPEPIGSHNLCAWISDNNGRGLNQYLHAAVGKERKGKLLKTDVMEVRAPWVDLDPEGGERFESSRREMLAALRGYHIPPSCIIDSGNGYQAYWFLDEPFAINGDLKLAAQFEQRTEQLYKDFDGTGGDGCWSCEHLLRLPDSINVLTAKKATVKKYPSGNRPARIIDWYPDRVYHIGAFGCAPYRDPEAKASVEVDAAERVESLEVLRDKYGVEPWGLLNIQLGNDVDALHAEHVKIEHRVEDGPYKGKRSDARIAALCELGRCGVPTGLAVGLLLDERFGISAAVLERKDAAKYADKEVRDAYAKVERDKSGKPVIEYDGTDLSKVLTETQAAMIAAGVPLYQRSGKLVSPRRLPADSIQQQVKRQAGTMIIESVTAEALPPWMTDAALFTKWDARSKKPKPWEPSVNFARTLLAWKHGWTFPVLVGISDAPFLRVDGTICDAEGYDDTSMMLVDFGGGNYAAIPECPTKEQALEAVGVLDRVLCGFPFDAKVSGLVKCPSRSVAISLFLSLHVSQSIDAVPLHIFRAPEAGAGKTLVIQSAGIAATGVEPPAMSYTGREEEDEKRLVGAYMAGGPILFIDNVKKGEKLKGDFLCASITGPTTSCRKLGLTGQHSVPTNSCIAASGNNVGVEGDLVRRTLVCTIDPQMECPETRKFDVNPRAYCLEHRAEIVAACLIIMRAFIVADERQAVLDNMQPLGGFERWSELVRAPLLWLGEVDPCLSMEGLRAENPEKALLGDLMAAWRDAPPLGLRDPLKGEDHGWFTLGQVLAASATYEAATLDTVLKRLFPPPRIPTDASMGKHMTAVARTVVRVGKSDLRFEYRQEPDTRRSQYALCSVSSQGELPMHQRVSEG